MAVKPKYLVRINSNNAVNNGDPFPFSSRPKYNGKIALIDPNNESKMDPCDYINEEACEACHGLHYHSNGIIFDDEGIQILNHGDYYINDYYGYVDICLECCDDLKKNN